jgi:hypothetical protein
VIQNTALGEASADLLEGAAKPWIDNSRCDIKLRELIDDKLNEGRDEILVLISFLDIGITYLF